MKQKLFSQTIFVAKSLLWSLLLYITTMMVLNWDDITSQKGTEPIVTRAEAAQKEPVNNISETSPTTIFFKTIEVTGAVLMRVSAILY